MPTQPATGKVLGRLPLGVFKGQPTWRNNGVGEKRWQGFNLAGNDGGES